MATDVDPATGFPRQLHLKEKAAEREKAAETRAKKDAEFLSVISSDAGKKLTEMVLSKLFERIEKVLSDDAEARAYLTILGEMRMRKGTAKRALQALADKYGISP